MKSRLFLYKHAAWLLTLAFGVAVFLFWRFRYPFALTYQEQLQLFMFDGDYFCGRMTEPGGLARYVAEFLVQFYNNVTIGALIIAVLLMLVQRLTWRLMRSESHYALSFIPSIMLWYAMGDESVLLTYVVALLMTLAVALAWTKWSVRWAQWVKWLVTLLLIPVLYWFVGPLVLLAAVLMTPWAIAFESVIYSLALILFCAHFLPFPMMRVVLGISYYRFPVTLPYLLMAIPVVIWLLANFGRLLPKAKQGVNVAEVMLVLIVLVGLVDLGYDKKKYELIEYDYLVRVKDWNAIIAKAEKQTPDLPMSVSANNLALAMTGQLGDRAFEFYQRGTQGLFPKFERNFASSQLTGEIYFHLGMVNTAQRLAFESMEAIPNYNKSTRVVKRLAETNIINGQYKIAEKYLRMLEKTIFYRPWAQRMMAILGNEKAINEQPIYGTLRQYKLQEDLLFSDGEVDHICGQLFMHNQQNVMAAQYLLMMPLLDRDIERFIAYVKVVQNRIQYNPRSCQEAIAFAFMRQGQQPPQGIVSPMILEQMDAFARIYSSDKNSPELNRFKNTVWNYLMDVK
ncbi:MAG: hypothetical protein IJ159_02455 [Prevotella sp.]|nr:hypothetical protein [Prevotella sp.]